MEQSVLRRLLGARLRELLRMYWLRLMSCHLGLPSFMPWMTSLDTSTRDSADCTPGTASISVWKRSTAAI
jgi:hypothetical protein